MIGPIFTLTGGRTGTAWLAELIGRNMGVVSIHEPLAIDDFGTRMPDIALMRRFNDRGSDPAVRAFWNAKLAGIARLPGYAETNHTLGKCGLIEHLAASPLAASAVVLVIRRALLPTCLSHVMRGDFRNVTINWQWYLDPAYRNVIVDPAPYRGQLGQTLWYLHEMEARQLYYTRTSPLRLIPVDHATMTTPEGATALLAHLGHHGPTVLPPPRNAGEAAPPELVAAAQALIARIAPDLPACVDAYLTSGRRLDRAAATRPSSHS
jgi:hypothetical protein